MLEALAAASVVAWCVLVFARGRYWMADQRLGADPADLQVVVPQHEPQLRVELPEGAQLSVDGRQVPGPSPIDVPLTSGQPHQIEVSLEGFNPVSTRVTLEPNDVRILSVQAEQLQRQQR